MNRVEILAAASDATANDRQIIYGDPIVGMNCAAELINVYLSHNLASVNTRSPAHNAAVMLALVKLARIATGAYHLDNYVDAAAYFAIAGEIDGQS